jgi:tetraacyldisaccharide 4'-kinase
VEGEAPDAARDGDEAVLLAATVVGGTVIVGTDRVRSAQLAAERGATVAILDDGHQHRRIARTWNLLIWDRDVAGEAGRWTPLREPRSGLARANVLLLVDRGDGAPARPLDAPACAATFRVRLVPRAPRGARPASRVYALSGVGNPASFERSLTRGGLVLVGATRYADHHPFSGEDIAQDVRRARALGAEAIATTAKDRVRAPDMFDACGIEVWAFDLDVESPDEDALMHAIALAIAEERRERHP